MRFALALIAATVAISLTDWLLFGVVFHERYAATPATWRNVPEGKKIAVSMLFAAIGTAAFFCLAHSLNLHGVADLTLLTGLTWAAASLPQTVTNTLYVNYAPVLVVSHSLGWLARLAIAAAAYGMIIG
jgi:hypothetical protein